MSSTRVELCLEYNDELIQSVSVVNTFKAIDRQRYLWVKLYGLTPKKNWNIYINIVSSMGITKPLRLTKTQFNHLKKKQNENANTIAEFI